MGLVWHHHPPGGWGHLLEAVRALRQEGWELCQQVAGGCDAYGLMGVGEEKLECGGGGWPQESTPAGEAIAGPLTEE